jgi:hypothetical protein
MPRRNPAQLAAAVLIVIREAPCDQCSDPYLLPPEHPDETADEPE